jgi:putative NADH-flavin reductase
MRILVIGATGRTGLHVLEQGLRRGHAITAFTRHPETLKAVQGLKTIVHGDAFNLDDVRKALQEQDAVISAIGGSDIAFNLIKAMPEAGVRRLVMTSSRSVVATRPQLAVTLAWLFLREFYADHARAEGMLQVSGLDWTIVRATMLTNRPMTGHVHIDFERNVTAGAALTLTRADYAMTLLDVIENAQMIGKALGVCGAKQTTKTAATAV